ncbi:Variant-specific surface protein [Giardia duodenalis assemblage B]|uniref:Variant-specific surface protein n=1 Tax=Giardia duodenalis assemblage B TaxID=1394984 RepID=A0A132NRG0_GIAIN|nr:Variant-specific surface protein [Giardia intestinalis assemblage B]
MCEMVGTTEICTQCKTGGNVPIDGVCVDKTAAVDKCLKADGQPLNEQDATCGQCGDSHFLFKGGCYNADTAPGNLICSAIDEANTAVCKTCATGYFKNPAASDATHQSCIACNETTAVYSNAGVANCATCDPPETSGGAATCTVCADGYYGSGSPPSCTVCTDSCATCTASGTDKCTSCKGTGDNQYFKKGESNDGTGTCVTAQQCTSTHFPATDANQKKICTLCSDAANGGIDGCTTCTPKTAASLAETPSVTCSACTQNKKPNADGTKCIECTTEGCAKCSDEGVCVECDSSKYLTPTGQCVDKCEKLGSYYADGQRVCQPCDPSCASCVGASANQCSACPARKVLQYTSESDINGGGSCVDECRVNTDGCADCGATIGSSKYCSRCSTSSEYPVNGVCKASTARAGECQTPDNKGGCTMCATGYFLLDGGCYQTSRQPGSQVCTAATSGSCTTCANGQAPNNGVCPACPSGCSKCSNSNTCTECYSGYYLLLIHV